MCPSRKYGGGGGGAAKYWRLRCPRLLNVVLRTRTLLKHMAVEYLANTSLAMDRSIKVARLLSTDQPDSLSVSGVTKPAVKDSVAIMTAAQNGPILPVRQQALTECGREVAANAAVFCVVIKSSDCPDLYLAPPSGRFYLH
ncbi:hypothetical protein EVAR_62270_1 [Eumeta japonica]|uniref:Uncharacterized protein n=1 Tax=Eumeta variegata TaxID=151549 RepID=A0A4C1YW67_EUMVA|nr:hypothetical protein EVAR_62270_1 [Eumeta japonica]